MSRKLLKHRVGTGSTFLVDRAELAKRLDAITGATVSSRLHDEVANQLRRVAEELDSAAAVALGKCVNHRIERIDCDAEVLNSRIVLALRVLDDMTNGRIEVLPGSFESFLDALDAFISQNDAPVRSGVSGGSLTSPTVTVQETADIHSPGVGSVRACQCAALTETKEETA